MLKTSAMDSFLTPSRSLTLLFPGLRDLVPDLPCPLSSRYLSMSLCFPSFFGLRRTIFLDLGLFSGYLVHVPLELLFLGWVSSFLDESSDLLWPSSLSLLGLLYSTSLRLPDLMGLGCLGLGEPGYSYLRVRGEMSLRETRTFIRSLSRLLDRDRDLDLDL